MSNDQRQDLCVFQNESMTILLEVFDEDNQTLDLTGARVLFVVWDDVGSFTKDSNNGGIEVEILDQVNFQGQAKIKLLPSDLDTVALRNYNIWVDLAGGEQHLVVPPSRFQVLEARRS